MVDLTPRALLHRLERGVVYPPDRAMAALKGFFKEPTLVALRELAMRQTAYSVESHYAHDDTSQCRGRSRGRSLVPATGCCCSLDRIRGAQP